MSYPSIKLAIVDDHALFRSTLSNYLDQHYMEVVVEASSVVELLRKLRNARVNVLLMDIFMPDVNAVDAFAVIREEFAELKTIVVSMSTDPQMVCDMVDAGVHGYVSKGEEPEELLKAINAVAENRIYRNQLFTEALYWHKQSHIKSEDRDSAAQLTEREKELLKLLWEEKNNKEIADEFFLGVRSIEKMRQDLKLKLGVKSTVGLLKYAIRKKIITVSAELLRSGR